MCYVSIRNQSNPVEFRGRTNNVDVRMRVRHVYTSLCDKFGSTQCAGFLLISALYLFACHTIRPTNINS